MGGLALLFPGQGSQSVGMGVALRVQSRRAEALFALADRVTGLPVTRLCEQGPLDALTATEVAQPAVMAASLAALAVLEESLGGRLEARAVAGHSVGELAACVAAGALSAEKALELVHLRAQSMARACALVDGTMAAILGLDEASARRVCESASDATGTVQVANLNGAGQVVVAGERRAVERAGRAARDAGARRVLPLTVGGPFHCVYMQPAAAALANAVRAVAMRPFRIPLVGNVEGRSITTAKGLRRELSAQVAACVRWTDVMAALSAAGCDRFIEIGPGQVLTGLVRRAIPGARATAFASPVDLQAVATLLADGQGDFEAGTSPSGELG